MDECVNSINYHTLHNIHVYYLNSPRASGANKVMMFFYFYLLYISHNVEPLFMGPHSNKRPLFLRVGAISS